MWTVVYECWCPVPKMEYLRYYFEGGFWYPHSAANLSEHCHNIVVAGRSVRFDMRKQMPASFAIYWALESAYRDKTGRRAHTFHKLTDDQYKIVAGELAAVIRKDPCDREWMKRRRVSVEEEQAGRCLSDEEEQAGREAWLFSGES